MRSQSENDLWKYAKDLLAYENLRANDLTQLRSLVVNGQSRQQQQIDNLAQAYLSMHDGASALPFRPSSPSLLVSSSLSSSPLVPSTSSVPLSSSLSSLPTSSGGCENVLPPFASSTSNSDGQNNDNVDDDAIIESSSSSSRQVEHGSSASSVTCSVCGASVFIPAEITSSQHQSQPSQPSAPITFLGGGFKLTAEENKLLEDGLEQRLWHKLSDSTVGNIQWDRVEQAFASKADNQFIFKRSAARLQSTYQNYPREKKRRLNGKDAGDKELIGSAASSSLPLNTSSNGIIASQPSPPSTMSTLPITSSQPTHASSSSSLSSSSSNSSSRNNNVVANVKKNKTEQPFSDEEKKMIKKWGREKVGQVTSQYLFQQHHNFFSAKLGYGRHGDEMKTLWKNSDDRKNKKDKG
jgi:hypothetical protein